MAATQEGSRKRHKKHVTVLFKDRRTERLIKEQVRKGGLPPLLGEKRGQATLPDLFAL